MLGLPADKAGSAHLYWADVYFTRQVAVKYSRLAKFSLKPLEHRPITMWTLPVLTATAALLLVLNVYTVRCVPPEMSPDMYCLGCKATVKELIKVIESKDNKHKSHANKVAKAMETTCKHDNFNRLKYVPGKYVEACLQLLETYHSTVESLLMNTDHSNLEQELCHDLSDACHGAPDHKHDPTRPEIIVDDNGNVKFVDGTHVKAKRPNPVRPSVHSEL